MLESTQGSCMRHGEGFYPIHPITAFMRAGASALMQLVSPEDTSESAGGRKPKVIQYDGHPVGGAIKAAGAIKVAGAIKLVFWMAAAIILSVMIGQLS